MLANKKLTSWKIAAGDGDLWYGVEFLEFCKRGCILYRNGCANSFVSATSCRMGHTGLPVDR